MEKNISPNYLEVLKVSIPGIHSEKFYRFFVQKMHESGGDLEIAELIDESIIQFGKNPYHIISESEACVRMNPKGKPNSELFPIYDGRINITQKENGIYVARFDSHEDFDFADSINERPQDEVVGVSFVGKDGATSPFVATRNPQTGQFFSKTHPIKSTPSMNLLQILDIIHTSEGNCDIDRQRLRL